MSKPDQDPTSGNGQISEQIPHSGIHGNETPVREFGTPLQDAVEQGLVTTPDSPAPLLTTKVESNNRKRNILIGVGTAAAGAAAVIGLTLGKSGGEQSTPRSEAPASAPATPAVSEAPVVTPTPEVAPLAEIVPVSVETTPDPGKALAKLLNLRVDYINDGSVYFDEERKQEYLSAIYGTTDPTTPHIEATSTLQEHVYGYNEELYMTAPEGTPKFKFSLEDIKITSKDGQVVGYEAIQGSNIDEIPASYHDDYLKELLTDVNGAGTITLAQQNGSWVIVEVSE